MLSAWWVLGASGLYLLLLFAVAYFADWRAQQGRSVIANPWTYALSTGGVLHRLDLLWQRWACCIGWGLVFADLSGANTGHGAGLDGVAQDDPDCEEPTVSRRSPTSLVADMARARLLAGLGDPDCGGWASCPTLPCSSKRFRLGYALLTTAYQVRLRWHQRTGVRTVPFTWHWPWPGSPWCLVPGIWTRPSAMRGMVAAIAFESVIKLLAFLAVGLFVVYGLFQRFG
jgi:hypothetical protein